MPAHWYTLHSHPHKEEALYRLLQMQEMEVYYPCLHVKPVNPRARKIRPYFPGYLFVRADLEQTGLTALQRLPYSTGLVLFGGEPAAVPETLIQAIDRRLSELQAVGVDETAGLRSGDPVLIQSGPFAGYEAIFDTRLSGVERVRVLLKMLSERSLPVELDANQLERKNRPGRPT